MQKKLVSTQFIRKTTVLVILLATGFVQHIYAQNEHYKNYSRWSVGATMGMPFFWGDMSSFSSNRTYVGYMGGLQVGYQYTPFTGFGLSLDYGQNKVGSYGYSSNFLLNTSGNTCCCPPETGVALPYSELYAKVRFFSAGLHADFNMNYLFAPAATTKHFTVLLSPAVYFQHYSPKVYNKSTDRQFTDGSLSNKLSIGLGGDVALRYRINKDVDLQLKSGLVWITDPHFEGINGPSRSKSNMAWNSAVGVVIKLNGKEKTDNLLYARREIIPQNAVNEPNDAIVQARPIPQEVVVTGTIENNALIAYPVLPVVYFSRNNAIIDTGRYAEALNTIVAAIEKFPNAKIRLSGFGDHVGGLDANEQVATLRTQTMHEYLVSRGINANRIRFGYRGIDNKLTGSDGYSERARRVEVVLED